MRLEVSLQGELLERGLFGQTNCRGELLDAPPPPASGHLFPFPAVCPPTASPAGPVVELLPFCSADRREKASQVWLRLARPSSE